MVNKIKFLHIGDFRFEFYDKSLFDEIKKIDGMHADKFEFSKYFKNYKYKNILEKLYYGVQNRYKFGPIINRINSDILKAVNSENYDLIFIWRGIYIKPSTLIKIKSKKIILFGYNNDATFSKKHPNWLFRLLEKQVQYYDHFYSYRESDIPVYKKKGCNSSIFLPTFDPSRTYPIENIVKKFDVVFVGHYENDGRDLLFLKLHKIGIKISLHGQGWNKSPFHQELKEKFGEITPAYENYNEVINSGKIALNLLSKSNDDTYTRRSLEIPSTKTAMLAPITTKHLEWFKFNHQAFYYNNYDEVPEIILKLLQDPDKINYVSQSGFEKVMNGEFQLKHRVDMILNDYKSYKNA